MLSRRVVRIKIMQLLYALRSDESLTTQDVVRRYQEYVQKTFEFYLLNVQYFVAVAEYAKKDGEIRKAKLRPLPEDEIFKPKLAENQLFKSLSQDKGINNLISKHGIKELIKDDHVKRMYNEFAKTDEYRKYLLKKDSDEQDNAEMLLALYRFLVASESFNEDMEDTYFSWEDDKSLVIGAMKKTIKALPVKEGFYEEFLPDEEVTKDFGEFLLKTACVKDKEIAKIIEPNLRNWDADRVATLDMVCIKMGITEFLECKTIPTKVTLNEYVEITKVFSTDKSKDFVNGILDRILKKLQKDELIVKEGRGLLD